MNKLSQQNETFKLLLNEVGTEVEGLKQQIRELKKDNARLKAKLEEEHEKQTDIFSAITESERLALRNHVEGLITKINHHLRADS